MDICSSLPEESNNFSGGSPQFLIILLKNFSLTFILHNCQNEDFPMVDSKRYYPPKKKHSVMAPLSISDFHK